MLLSIIFIPFLASFILGFLGRFFGNNGSSLIACFGLFINFFFSIFFFFYSYFFGDFFFSCFGYWLSFGAYELFWSFSFESLALVMFIVVNTVSFIVHLFSFGYMNQDPHLSRFMSYISFFTFFMLVLVTADNLVQLFLGWEGVGLCSYLLIGFWYTRINAISSALKALIVNRISDFALVIGILLIFWLIISYEFSVIFAIIPFFFMSCFLFFKSFFIFNILTMICFFFLIGAMGKSAQILLHTWLPDAMEGPTPVSALIHAATMVTAGIFLIIKSSLIFEYSGLFLSYLFIVGGLTSFMSGTIGMVQYDIKKVIAYSTCSQLGYMLLACGLSNYFVSFFHLMNHAFFKALLFLCAGCIIHSSNNEQDMRRFGSFSKILPVVFFFVFLGSCALSGFTFLTGFYSKDFILEQLAFLFYSYHFGVEWVFINILLFITTVLTSYYSLRLFIFTFIELSSFSLRNIIYMHESNFFLLLPLIILVFGTVFVGFIFRDFFIGLGSDAFGDLISVFPSYSFFIETELLGFKQKCFFFIFFIFFSVGLFFLLVGLKRNRLKGLLGGNKSISFHLFSFFYTKIGFEFFLFFQLKWGFDLIYNNFINKKVFFFFYFHLYELFDKLFLERICGHFSIIHSSVFFSKTLRLFFQNGILFFYFFFFLLLFMFLILA